MNQQMAGLGVGIVILLIGVAGFAHIIGGSKWSGAIMRTSLRVVRFLTSLPIALLAVLAGWLSQGLHWLAKVVRGGGRGGGGHGRHP